VVEAVEMGLAGTDRRPPVSKYGIATQKKFWRSISGI